ncbi:class I SAM-dependent methyltransferase [Vreelandella aquamarina]
MKWRCPLCMDEKTQHYHRDSQRDYYQCAKCKLIFVPQDQHLSTEQEKQEYDRHQNSPEDQGYRRFLSRLLTPLEARLAPHAKGLDFGSGPGPTLSVMFEERGYPMAIYDPFYAPERSTLETRYDFITATEVLEHLSSPHAVMEQLRHMLNPEGYLGVMTKRVKNHAAFTSWHYIQDPTHVAFFSEETFDWWATQHGFCVEFPGQDTVIMQKRG